MNINHAEHCAAQDRQDRMRHCETGGPNRLFLGSSRVENAVGDAHWDRVVLDLVLVNLDRAEDATRPITGLKSWKAT